jgi:AcrR family transcriptional regulator
MSDSVRTEIKPEMQTRILEAGVSLWIDEPPSILFGGYTVARVAKAAGVTRSTFYSYWPSTKDYLENLIDHLAHRETAVRTSAVSEAITNMRLTGPDIVAGFLSAFDAQFDAVLADPALRIRLGFLSQMDDPEVAERLRDHYKLVEQRSERTHAFLMENWGRKTRAPLNDEQLRAIYSTITDALAARHRIDPEGMPREIYGYVALTLLLVITARVDDPRDLEAVFDPVNSWPSSGLAIKSAQMSANEMSSANPPKPLDPDMAREVAVATRRLITRIGWSELSLAEIAVVTGFPERTLAQAFGSKSGLAMAIFELNVSERFEILERTSDPITDFRAMLKMSAEELRRSPAIAQSVVLLYAGAATRVLPGLIQDSSYTTYLNCALEAQAAGQLNADLDVALFIPTLLRLLLLENCPSPTGRQDDAGAIELLLRGAGAPPEPTT